MASFCKPQHLVAMLLLLFLILATSSLSSARLLKDFRSDGLPATEITLDLALAAVEDHESEQVPKPCDHHMVAMKRPHVGILRSPTQRLAGKYGPMILNRLPKGEPVPPSAPSKGINNINN